MEEKASVHIPRGGDCVVVVGCADLNLADDLDAAIYTVSRTHASVLVDLERATLLDSRVIAVLAAWNRRLRARSGGLPLACENPNIRRLFQMMGLDGEFDFVQQRVRS